MKEEVNNSSGKDLMNIVSKKPETFRSHYQHQVLLARTLTI